MGMACDGFGFVIYLNQICCYGLSFFGREKGDFLWPCMDMVRSNVTNIVVKLNICSFLRHTKGLAEKRDAVMA